MTRKILTGIGLATVLTLSAAAPAALADSPVPGQPVPGLQAKPDPAKRAARLCKRVPKVQQRVTRLTARISGDADTRGSVQWLQARADKVRAKDPALAAIIDGRAKIRQSRLATLKLRSAQLPKVTAWCKAHGR